MDAHDQLVEHLKRLARRRLWSMNRLADAAGIAHGTMSNILNKKQSPTLNTLEKLAAALEIPLIDLFQAATKRTTPSRETVTERP